MGAIVLADRCARRSRLRVHQLTLIGCVAVATLLTGSVPATGASSAYRVRHHDLRSVPWNERSFTGWQRLRIRPRPPIDSQGIPMVRDGGVLSYAVGELSMNGMKRLTRWRVHCEERQLAQALAQARKLRRLAVPRRGRWWIPHGFDYAPLGLKAPWYDAMVQGLALSFFVRLHDATGDGVHIDAARRVFRSFLALGPGHHRWVARVDDDDHLWLEHAPHSRLTRVLNAHLHSLFGLYEYWDATGSARARRLLEGAITTIEDELHRFRRPGSASRYSLSSGAAKDKYHHIHVWQLRLLAKISGEPYFQRMADRFARDLPGRPTWRGTPGYPPSPPPVACRAASE